MSLNVRPCLYWGLSHLWSVTNAAGLLQAPSSHQMTWLEWKSEACSAAAKGWFLPCSHALKVIHSLLNQGETGLKANWCSCYSCFQRVRLDKWKTSEKKVSEEIDRNHNFMGVAINSRAKAELQKRAVRSGCYLVFLKILKETAVEIGSWRGEENPKMLPWSICVNAANICLHLEISWVVLWKY